MNGAIAERVGAKENQMLKLFHARSLAVIDGRFLYRAYLSNWGLFL
ncbi:MAG: hypothetical protein QX203_19730 [Methylococcaceae bacterium]